MCAFVFQMSRTTDKVWKYNLGVLGGDFYVLSGNFQYRINNIFIHKMAILDNQRRIFLHRIQCIPR